MPRIHTSRLHPVDRKEISASLSLSWAFARHTIHRHRNDSGDRLADVGSKAPTPSPAENGAMWRPRSIRPAVLHGLPGRPLRAPDCIRNRPEHMVELNVPGSAGLRSDTRPIP